MHEIIPPKDAILVGDTTFGLYFRRMFMSLVLFQHYFVFFIILYPILLPTNHYVSGKHVFFLKKNCHAGVHDYYEGYGVFQ
jgi:hypothetical protein